MERAGEVRHEFVDGKRVALEGASKTHSRIKLNITLALGAVVIERGCRLHCGNTHLLTSCKRYYYPDVMVVCQDNGDAYLEETPCFIAEIISKAQKPPTEARSSKHTATFPAFSGTC